MKKIIIICGLLASSLSFGGIDPYIPLQVKPIDTVKMMQDGDDLSKIMINNRIEREKTRIYNEGNGDGERMLSLAKQSKLARFVVPYFQEQAYKQQIYELNKLKLQKESSDIKQDIPLNISGSTPPLM